VVTLLLSCAANTVFPTRGKLAQHTPIPNLYADLEQTSVLDQISASVPCVATNFEILEDSHFGRLILGL